MAFDSYDALSAALGSWEERTFATTDTDEFISIAEAWANRKLGQDFRRRSSASIAIDADGLGAVPGGFVGMTSLVRDLSGSVPLKQVTWDALVTRNPDENTDDAQVYAINGAVLRVTPIVADNFIAKFSAVLASLSATNTTNWLLALAPDYYLVAGRAASKLKMEDYQGAALAKGLADEILDQLVSQGNVAEYGNAEMTLASAP